MDQNYQKVTLKNSAQDTALYNKTLASCIIFEDGETLQQKYNNGTLIEDGILGGITAVSPTIDVAENTTSAFKLKIKSINGNIITPNLIGPKGPKGDAVDADGMPLSTIVSYVLDFNSNDLEKISESNYILRISREKHGLGFSARVTEVLRWLNDSETQSVIFAYKRFVNGDVSLLFNEPFAGIVYLEGEK